MGRRLNSDTVVKVKIKGIELVVPAGFLNWKGSLIKEYSKVYVLEEGHNG